MGGWVCAWERTHSVGPFILEPHSWPLVLGKGTDLDGQRDRVARHRVHLHRPSRSEGFAALSTFDCF